MNAYRWSEVGSILIGLILLILIVEYMSNKIRTKLVGGSNDFSNNILLRARSS